MGSLADCDGVVIDAKVMYRWEIPNFCTSCPKVKKILKSPILVHPASNSKFQLKVYPQGYNEESNQYVSVFLYLLDNKRADVAFKIAIINHLDKECFIINSRKVFGPEKYSWGITMFVKQTDIMNNRTKYLLNNKIKFLCEITVNNICDDDNDAQGPKRPRLDLNPIPTPISGYNFEQFFTSKQFSDFSFVFGGNKRINAHKFILASKSEVFLALFKNQTLKDIKVNIDFKVFEEMLRFIYTNRVNDLSKIARELLVCAERYALSDLKLLCETSLCDNISTSSALELVSYAELHKLTKLRELTIDYIVSNMKEVVNTPNFKSTAVRYPDVCVEILHRCANQN